MKLLQFFQFAYLVFAVLFIYDGITHLNEDSSRWIMSFLLAGLAIFMFFFRRRFKKRFEERQKLRDKNK